MTTKDEKGMTIKQAERMTAKGAKGMTNKEVEATPTRLSTASLRPSTRLARWGVFAVELRDKLPDPSEAVHLQR